MRKIRNGKERNKETKKEIEDEVEKRDDCEEKYVVVVDEWPFISHMWLTISISEVLGEMEVGLCSS